MEDWFGVAAILLAMLTPVCVGGMYSDYLKTQEKLACYKALETNHNLTCESKKDANK